MGHSYRDLIVWQKAITMVTEVYRVTQSFPREEIYGLTSQLRRAAVSVASNIAEGQGRISKPEFRQFLGIPAGKYLIAHGVQPADFNSYGSRRGNHEVMVRGTFANVRLRNKMVNTEGGFTRHLPDGAEMSIFDASEKYHAEKVPLVILAGKEYGSGSSRDWAAKGPRLLGVRAVVAESYERIHRSNLVGMGILPLQFLPGENAETLKLTGEEVFEIAGIRDVVEKFSSGRNITVRVKGGKTADFQAIVRIDTPQEALYYANGGILQYVLRQLLAGKAQPEAVIA